MNTAIIKLQLNPRFFQIAANCSPFESLNMLPFHIKPERDQKIVKARGLNEIKPPNGKMFQKYKPIWHYFVMP